MQNLPKNLRYSLIAIFLLAMPLLLSWSAGNTWLRVLDLTLLYIMLALGLNIVVGFAGLLDLGYVAFYAIGAYTYALLSSHHFGVFLSPWLILPLGALLAGIFGIILGFPVLRLRGDYLAIVTLGFGEIIRIFMNNLNHPINITNGPKGIARIEPIFTKEFADLIPLLNQLHLQYYLFLFFTVITIFISLRLKKSRIGRAWIAIREDQDAAKACGINVTATKLTAFAIGATFAGIAGGLFASMQQFVSPESFILHESILIVCMVVIGGMGHVPGVILGAIIIAVLPELFRSAALPVQEFLFNTVIIDPETLRLLLFGLALVLIMLYKPAGLWADRRHLKEFKLN